MCSILWQQTHQTVSRALEHEGTIILSFSIGSGGCFFEAVDKKPYGFKISGTLRDESESKLWNCTQVTGYESGYTAERAWCFQETLLSPRSVYFERGQLYWRCRTYEANESFPQGIDHLYTPLKATTTSRDMDSTKFLNAWAELIERYSSGSLTNWSDRLVALTGIAELFGNKSAASEIVTTAGSHNKTYLAGLWRSNLEVFLVWRSILRDPNRQLLSYPSWSWASSSGEIILPRISERDLILSITVLEADTTLESSNTFGSVSTGFVRLRCNAPVEVKLEYYGHGRHKIYFDGLDIQDWLSLDFNSSEDEEAFIVLAYTEDVSGHGMFRHQGLLLKKREVDGKFWRIGSYMFNARQGIHYDVGAGGQFRIKDEFGALSYLFERSNEQQIIEIV